MDDMVAQLEELARIPHQYKPRPAKEPGGVLEGVRLGQRVVADGLHEAGFRDDNLFVATAVCGAESWLFTRAHNDNRAEVSHLRIGQRVRNVETLELVTVVDPPTGKIRLSDGEIVTVPLTVEYITSRDVGLMEINVPADAIGTDRETSLYDAATNFAAAYNMHADRGFEPWVAFTSSAYLHDTYRLWAFLGVGNRWEEKAAALAAAAGVASVIRTPALSVKTARGLWPIVPLG